MAISEKAIKAIEANSIARNSLMGFSNIQKEYKHNKDFLIDTIKWHINKHKKECKKTQVHLLDEFYKKLVKKLREDKEIISLVADLYQLADLRFWQVPEAIEFEFERRKTGLPIASTVDKLQSAVEMVVEDISTLPNVEKKYLVNKDFWYSVIKQCDEDDLEDFSAVVPQEFYEDKEFLYKIASIRGEALKYIWEPSIYTANKKLILQAISSYPEIYEEISPTLQNDIDIIVELAKNDDDNLDLVAKSILMNEDVIYELVDVTEGQILEHLGQKDLIKKEIFISAVEYDADLLVYASDILTRDEKFMTELIKINGKAYDYASEDIQKKREILLIAMETDDYAIHSYPLDYENDDELIKLALTKGAFDYNPPEFVLNNREYAKLLLLRTPWNIEKVSDTLVDEEMILQAISGGRKYGIEKGSKNEKIILKYIPEEWLDDKRFVMLAIESGLSLRCVSDRLSDDKEVVSLAVNKNPYDVEFISKELRKNISFMLEFLDKTDEVFRCICWWNIDSMTEKETLFSGIYLGTHTTLF